MRVLVASESGRGLEGIREQALGLGLTCDAEDCVSTGNLVLRLTQAPAELILLGVDQTGSAAAGLVRAVHDKTGRLILVVGPKADAAALVELLRNGAREYLDRAQLRAELSAALENLKSSGRVEMRAGRGVAVVSANPGSGVTTVATSLAFALAEDHPGNVLLAEVGESVPELAIDLDLKTQYGVAELVRDRERMDAAMIRQTSAAHPAGVHVLAYTAETLTPAAIQPDTMRRMCVLFRSMYDFSVLDLGHGLSASALEGMRLAETVVVVLRLDVPSLRLGRKYCRQLNKEGIPSERIQVVANRYNQRGLVSWRQVGDVIGLPVQSWVPDDPGTINRALREGQPLLQAARRAAITTSITKLAKQLNGMPAK